MLAVCLLPYVYISGHLISLQQPAYLHMCFCSLYLSWPVPNSKPQNTKRYKDPNNTDGRKLTSNKSYSLAIQQGMSKSQHGSLRLILILLPILEMMILAPNSHSIYKIIINVRRLEQSLQFGECPVTQNLHFLA